MRSVFPCPLHGGCESFEEIGELAAVAAIRTALNFFLKREIRTEKETNVVISQPNTPSAIS